MKKHLLAVAVTALAAGSVFAQANDTLAKIKASGSVTLGVRESSGLSYTLGNGKYVGFHTEMGEIVLHDIQKQLGLAKLDIKYLPVTSQNRVPLVQNGTVDIECGSTTNNLTRQKQVAYLAVTFITGTKLGSKKGSGITEIEDLEGKAIALSQGTTNEKAIKRIAKAKGIKIKIVPVKDHPQGWLALETGRVDAYATDDVLLYGLISKSKNPGQFQVTGRFLSYDPYGIMVPQDDSTYQRLGNVVLADLMRSGEMQKIYDKWFNPGPTGINMPISSTLKTAYEIQALPH